MEILAVLAEFDRPVTSGELYKYWRGEKALEAIKYHLSTLVKSKLVELVIGPELRFRLMPAAR